MSEDLLSTPKVSGDGLHVLGLYIANSDSLSAMEL